MTTPERPASETPTSDAATSGATAQDGTTSRAATAEGTASAPEAVPVGPLVDPTPAEATPGRGRSMAKVDLGVGLFFVGLGVFVLWAGRDLAVLTANSPGPGFLPLGLAIIFLVAGAALAVKQFISPSTGTVSAGERGGTVRVLAVFALLAVVVVGLETLGFITSMLILMAGVMFGLERKFTIAALATVILVPVGFWALFAVLLGVRLPEGPLFFYF